MIIMCDEYGHTKGGNNNTYCHDDAVSFLSTLKLSVRYCHQYFTVISSSVTIVVTLVIRLIISGGIRRTLILMVSIGSPDVSRISEGRQPPTCCSLPLHVDRLSW